MNDVGLVLVAILLCIVCFVLKRFVKHFFYKCWHRLSRFFHKCRHEKIWDNSKGANESERREAEMKKEE